MLNMKFKSFILNIRNSFLFTPVIALIFMIIILSLLSTHFLTISNAINVLRQISIISIVAVGMTYTILTGGIDLSVGSVVALSGVITAILLKNYGVNMYLAMVIGIFAGVICGSITGSLITSKIKMPPFIAGLVIMSIMRGVALVITDGRPIFNLPKQFEFLGNKSLIGVPILVFIMIIVYIIAYINLNYTKMGMSLYATGGNENAARLAGINTNRIKLSAYMISGLTAGIAGVCLASRVMVGEPIAGYNYELDAIAASVIGGADFIGGTANIWGTLTGSLIIGLLRNGLNLLNISTYYQQIAIGSVVALTISFNLLKKNK